MMDRSDDSSHHERTLLPRSYISLRTCLNTILGVYLLFFSVSFFFLSIYFFLPSFSVFSFINSFFMCLLFVVVDKYVCYLQDVKDDDVSQLTGKYAAVEVRVSMTSYLLL